MYQLRLFAMIFFFATALFFQPYPSLAQSPDTDPIYIYGGLVWSPDDSMIAVGTTDGLWLHDSRDLSVIGQLAAGKTIHALEISPIDDRIALGMDDGIVEIWDLGLETQVLELVVTLAERRGPVRFLDWNANGTLITSHAGGSPGVVWDAATGEVILELLGVSFGMNWSTVSDEFVAEIENGGKPHVWNIEGEQLRMLQDGVVLLSTEWSPDGNFIVGAYGEQFYVWDADTAEIVFSTQAITRPQRGNITAIAWHPSAQFFALHMSHRQGTTFLSHLIQIWSVEDFTLVEELQGIRYIDLGVRSIAWSHSGDRFAAASGNGEVYIWDAETFTLLSEYDGYDSEENNF